MKSIINIKEKTLLLLLFCAMLLPLYGNTREENPSIFDLMTYGEVLDLTLETDFEMLKGNLHSNEYQKAHLTFKDVNGQVQSWGLKVKLRGAFRRMKCSDIPPLKLNFKKSDLKAAGLAPFDDLKLVPQCVEEKAIAKEIVLKEYLTYKLYNEISAYSFRVQLLRITYKDISTGKKEKQWAFLIEDSAQLCDRIGAEKGDRSFNLPIDSFYQGQARTVALFEYMIGNADWSFRTMKNVKYMVRKGKAIPVPYDFDFSGLVNASYAVPNSNLGLTSVQDRAYLGFVENTDQMHSTVYQLVGKRPKLESIILEFKLLRYEVRSEMVDYLRGFFDDPENIKRGEVVYISR